MLKNALDWQICGHKKLLEQLELDVRSENLPHALLLIGPSQIGKFTILKRLAGILHEQQSGSKAVADLIEKEEQIDTFIFRPEGNSLGIKEFRELQKYLHLSKYDQFKIVIIKDIERLSLPLQNAMLKILEEPPKGVYFFLSSSKVENVLKTIISRCRIYRIGLVQNDEIQQFLSLEDNDDILSIAYGRPGVGISLSKDSDKLEKIIQVKNVFESFLKTGISANQSIMLAEKLSALPKPELIETLQLLMILIHQELYTTNPNRMNLTEKLDAVDQTIEFVLQNVNVKIALEVLFLHCLTNSSSMSSLYKK